MRWLKDLAPIGSQIGVWPVEAAPAALHELLLGPMPTGGAAQDLRSYAIVDAAKLTGGATLIEQESGRHACLFQGDAARNFADFAPYLVEIGPDSRLLRLMMTHDPAADPRMNSRHLWHVEAGIFLRSRLDFDALWRHLRRFPRVQDQNNAWYYFRFWEPRFIMALADLQPDGLLASVRLLDPAAIDTVVAVTDRRGCVIRPQAALARDIPIRISPAEFELFRRLRRDRFLQRVGDRLEGEDFWDRLPEQQGGNLLERIYDEARTKGYRVEMACFNYIRSRLAALYFRLPFDSFEYHADPNRALSPLVRSRKFWTEIQQQAGLV